ncbi:MAG: hypothetical protein IKB43_06105 [Fibrobacter sp.]|nr:hypothetical protein [Fibrobacter sp.]
MNKKFLVGFSVLGVAAAAFWACGDGDVITKGGDDELALLNYGPPFAEGDEGNMKTLLNQAMADCAADEACAAKMEGAEYVPPESSAEGGEGGEGGEAPKSSASGPVSTNSGPVSTSSTPTGSSASGGNNPPPSSAVISDGTKPDGSCAPVPASIQKGGSVTWTFTKASLPAGSSVQQVMDYNNMVNAATCEWTMTGSTEGTASAPCKTNTATATYTKADRYSATLKIGDKTIDCGSVKVNGLPIKGCSCEATTPIVDIAGIEYPAKGAWSVACIDENNETITGYKWDNNLGTATTAEYTFTQKQPLSPKVTVSTAESDTVITCPSPKVIDGNNPEDKITLPYSDPLKANVEYTVTHSCSQKMQIAPPQGNGNCSVEINGVSQSVGWNLQVDTSPGTYTVMSACDGYSISCW